MPETATDTDTSFLRRQWVHHSRDCAITAERKARHLAR
jgi:hypothetical protein